MNLPPVVRLSSEDRAEVTVQEQLDRATFRMNPGRRFMLRLMTSIERSNIGWCDAGERCSVVIYRTPNGHLHGFPFLDDLDNPVREWDEYDDGDQFLRFLADRVTRGGSERIIQQAEQMN